ncbi:unnamed protein product [Prorocentrum cordatum]|uniref:Uncharacterized protein n=1 Tax=Prorocentrum cordatum TaxID=2364126 RepID=A0ABN9RYD7_9DINO|nr:unnamed protein product [Polarella glacialis]
MATVPFLKLLPLRTRLFDTRTMRPGSPVHLLCIISAGKHDVLGFPHLLCSISAFERPHAPVSFPSAMRWAISNVLCAGQCTSHDASPQHSSNIAQHRYLHCRILLWQ